MSMKDKEELERLGRMMMSALSWSTAEAPNWDSFRSLFHRDARLVPAARPAAPVPLEAFIDRMDGQRSSGALPDFREEHVAMKVHVFGNVATVLQTYQTIINKGAPGYGISAMTWIRENGVWLCMSMAWDAVSEDKHVPQEYL
jgi:hypothetical protein